MELTEIKSPKDLKCMSLERLNLLAMELRAVLLKKLSAHGGHCGPNLGMVEATIALHYVFDTPKDKLVFDVSHQTYVHKMLTGRIGAFVNPADYDKVTGYTNWEESPYDVFTLGHTSTSVSLAAGLAKARDLRGGDERVVALIGDGSLSGGEAFEGLDYAATLKSNFIVVVNDNDMSIAENHGGIYDNLRELRESDGKSENNYFKSLGFKYMYVPYGNDIHSLIDAFEKVKDTDTPIVVHISTMKGKGYAPAEAHKEQFHYNAPFDEPTGNPLYISEAESYDDIFSEYMLGRIKSDPNIAVITAGTPGVSGFTPELRKIAGRQFIDVGIAEQTAVALASGLAKGGVRPVFGVVSSFLQRAYDQLSQDVSINGTAPVVNIFYGGVAGMNDVTHLGWFDIVLVSNIPGWVYLAPTNREEYLAMLGWAISQNEHPVAVRVPSGTVVSAGKPVEADYSQLNKFAVTKHGRDVAIIGAGDFFALAAQAVAQLEESGVAATLINPRFLSGLDAELLESLKENHKVVFTLENGVLSGGFGEKVAAYYGDSEMKVKCYGLKKEFADRYNVEEMMAACRLTPSQIAEDALAML